MTETDVALLEWLDDMKKYGPADAAPPKQIHLYMEDPPTYSHLNRRLRKIADAGLVEKVEEGGYYEISELGQRYLHDPDASAEEFPVPGDEDGEEDDGES
jgi:DNA-binding PadR family transcriptional regulator